jgi:glucose-6-phosphate 1-epimerase
MRGLLAGLVVLTAGSLLHRPICAMSAPTDVTTLRSPAGAVCEVSKHGAHVLSWTPSTNAATALYMSPRAKYGAADAIRGGIPICFPQFGPRGQLPQHGFCRKSNDWELEGACSQTSAAFKLVATDATRQSAWPHEFECYYTVSLQDDGSLQTELRVKNTGTAPFSFTCALHTYFAVDDIAKTAVEGLQGCTYEDGLKSGEVATENDAKIRFAGEVDRVYGPAPATLTIADAGNLRAVTINKSDNFPDAVVWNPWIEKAKSLADMPDGDYQKFVCVEVGAIRTPVTVPAGSEWSASQRLSVLPLK